MELSLAIKYYNSFERVMEDDEIPVDLEAIYNHISEDDTLNLISKKIGKQNTFKFTYLYFIKKKGVNKSKYEYIIDNLKTVVLTQYIDAAYADADCDYCGGWGRETCNYCEGSGNEDCRTCDGSGEETCDSCDGDGEIDGETCDDCGGSGSLTCSNCGGDGDKTCSECGGDGDYECSNCDGNGTVETDDEYYQPEEFYYVKPVSDKDHELEDHVFELNKIFNVLNDDPLCLFLRKSNVGFLDNPVEETKSEFKTNLEEFETFEIFSL